MAKQNIRQVSIFINGNEVANSIKAIHAEQKKLTNELVNTVRGTEEYERKATELTRVNAILKDHSDRVRGIEKGWSLTKIGLDNFVGVAAGAFAVDNLLGYGKALFNTAAQMDILEKKAKTVFREALPQVTEEAKKNAAAMGLTSAQYINAAAAIQDILVPMGFQRRRAAEISTELTNLSGALSEWTGGQVSATQVSEILASALTGEREQLKQLGIVLQQSDIDAELAAKGLSKLTGESRQQAEATATLDLIMRKSLDAQNAYAEGADSLTRKSAELTAKLQEIYEKVSVLLIPVFDGLLNIVNDVSDALEDFSDPISNIPLASILFDTEGTDDAMEKVKKLREETDELLKKYGIEKPTPTPPKFDPNAGKKTISDAELKRRREEERERNEYEKIAAEQIRRAEQIQATVSDLIARESAKRQQTFQLEQEYMLDAYQATKEQQQIIDLDFEAEKSAAQEEIRLFLQSDQEAEIELLRNHYAVLLSLADQYGLDTAALRKKQEEEIAAINKKYADEESQRQYEANQARLAALGSMFTEFGNLATATFDLLAGEGERSAEFQKVATLAKIAFDTAAAISSLVAASEANPANALTFGAAGVAQYVSGIVRILSNIAQAKKILSGAPKVQQKAGGGFLAVTGADDGRTYNASVIPTPYTGLLPNHPVLFQSAATGAPVLASERGAEYFVSSEALRNPYVANLTRMIDNIAGNRSVAQFADGGANPPATVPTAPAVDMSVIERNTDVMEALLAALGRGIVAVIPDRTLTDIPERLWKINNASGGYFG